MIMALSKGDRKLNARYTVYLSQGYLEMAVLMVNLVAMRFQVDLVRHRMVNKVWH